MNLQLLVGSDEFMDAFGADVAAATRSVYVQVMTFEADEAGRRVVEMLTGSRAQDVRLLVDAYVECMISDRLVCTVANRNDPDLQQEAARTLEWLERELPATGVRTRLANPLGPCKLRLPARDHVKIYVIDRAVAYVGGINISDHNFAWHDAMLRIEDPAVAGFLAACFLRSWKGEPASGSFDFDGLDLVLFDGRSNERAFRAVTDLIDGARESIWIESPYISFPLFDHLRAAVSRGVGVQLVAPGRNNKPLMDCYTAWEADRSGIDLYRLPDGMTHLKACLVDGRALILGSSNLDYLSTTIQRELIAVVRDPALIADFRRRVCRADIARSVLRTGRANRFLGSLAGAGLRAAGGLAVAVNRVERIVRRPNRRRRGSSAMAWMPV